jgi:glycosyltransferase involved in cell wall biosynthesis
LFRAEKIAVVSVINDLATDHRVQKTCFSLLECGYKVILIGRKLPHSPTLPTWPFKSIRMNLFFRTGPLFYFFFNVRLFFRLLFTKSDLLFANDLDTLLPNFLIARLKGIPLIYDSHELFCEVPELQNAPFKKKIWSGLESFILPRIKHCITVNESIAEVFEKKYKTRFQVVRNIPDFPENIAILSRQELGLPSDKKIVLLQGAGINIDRGAEELVDAMKFVSDALLLIIGSGDVWNILEKKVQEGLTDKVRLIKRLPRNKLLQYTAVADIGISIDKNTNLNYYYSLPNKIFDYISCGLPILASRLPEVENIIQKYQVGEFITGHNPKDLAFGISSMLHSPFLSEYKKNALEARKSLTWQTEREKLIAVIEAV